MALSHRHNGSWLRRGAIPAVVLTLALAGRLAWANDIDATPTDLNLGLTPDPQKGLKLILTEPMGAAVMKESDPKDLWKIWEPEERAKTEGASEEQLRALTWQRYGWADRPDPDQHWIPLGYTPDGKGSLVTNCFSCHGGQVGGRTILGMGNTTFDLTTLATDVKKLRTLESGKDPSHVQDVVAPFNTPLNYHKGFSNAVIFAHVFAGLRSPELFAKYMQHPELLKHHDMNAPPWWNTSKKDRLYLDGFAPKTPRQLMPFAMSPIYTDEQWQSFEPNFVHIKAYIDQLDAPAYPYAIDRELAAKGKLAFEKNCSKCHGKYGDEPSYPNKVVKLKKVGTDPVRLTAVPKDRREAANASWLQYDGKYPLDLESEGYVAPPLDGIWATAPYLHNGSVPTLHDLFNVDERPKVWKRDDYGYDEQNVGLVVQTYDGVPDGLNSRERRMYYDTDHVGNSNAGHTFPDDFLSDDEKRAVIEYLKTL